MTLFVILFFDAQGDKAVRNIWQILANQQLSASMIEKKIAPHLTLGLVPYDKQHDLTRKLEAFANSSSPTPINMPYYGLFTSPGHVLFLGVTVTNQLYEFHRNFYHECQDYLDLDSLYIPDFWIPHVTLAHDLQAEQISLSLESCQHIALPIMTIVNRIALVESDPIEVLAEYALD